MPSARRDLLAQRGTESLRPPEASRSVGPRNAVRTAGASYICVRALYGGGALQPALKREQHVRILALNEQRRQRGGVGVGRAANDEQAGEDEFRDRKVFFSQPCPCVHNPDATLAETSKRRNR